MPRIVVKEIGLYDEIEYDNRGFPKHGTPATLTVTQGKDFDVILLVRLSGDPGSYWLTARMEAPEPYRVDISLPNEHVIVPKDGDTWLTFELSLSGLPIGTYAMKILLAETELAKLTFELEPKT